jgi:hypothetical protein
MEIQIFAKKLDNPTGARSNCLAMRTMEKNAILKIGVFVNGHLKTFSKLHLVTNSKYIVTQQISKF